MSSIDYLCLSKVMQSTSILAVHRRERPSVRLRTDIINYWIYSFLINNLCYYLLRTLTWLFPWSKLRDLSSATFRIICVYRMDTWWQSQDDLHVHVANLLVHRCTTCRKVAWMNAWLYSSNKSTRSQHRKWSSPYMGFTRSVANHLDITVLQCVPHTNNVIVCWLMCLSSSAIHQQQLESLTSHKCTTYSQITIHCKSRESDYIMMKKKAELPT